MLIAAVFYGIAGLLHANVPDLPSALCLQVICGVYGLLGAIGLLCQCCIRKYRSHLEWKYEENREMVRFAFSFGAVAKGHLYRYKEKQSKERQDSVHIVSEERQRGAVQRNTSILPASGTDAIASWLPG